MATLFDGAEGPMLINDIFELLKPEGWAKWLNVPLERAAAEGKRGLAQRLVGKGAEIGNALHAAVRGGHGEIVNDLLESEASFADKGTQGRTPLHVAAQDGHLEMLRVAIEHGADVEAAGPINMTPLHCASIENKAESIKESALGCWGQH